MNDNNLDYPTCPFFIETSRTCILYNVAFAFLRRDNVEIYCNSQNCEQVREKIQKIIKEYEELRKIIERPNLLFNKEL